MTISIQTATYVNRFKIRLEFSDGISRTLDFEPFLNAAKNPMTTQYLNEEKFKSFRLEFGDLVWGDFDLCFPIWDLHEGNI